MKSTIFLVRSNILYKILENLLSYLNKKCNLPRIVFFFTALFKNSKALVP